MRLQYVPTENALRLTLDRDRGEPAWTARLAGYVDVGEGGRIVGIETGSAADVDVVAALNPWLHDPVASEYVSIEEDTAYIQLSAPEEERIREHIRSADAELLLELDASGELVALSIPRRGAGYEISYPSGNQ